LRACANDLAADQMARAAIPKIGTIRPAQR
jgi:hypothetical protein